MAYENARHKASVVAKRFDGLHGPCNVTPELHSAQLHMGRDGLSSFIKISINMILID